MNEFFADKDYFISTSISEGEHCTLAESMAAGLMPLIRDWQGAGDLYPREYIFNMPAEAREILGRESLNPAEYRTFIEKTCPVSRTFRELDVILATEEKEEGE
ncbi:MAG: hypothetical protein JW941_08605 [Candidatus Coatesbacteria bacterium]|nr:hypothetical protein [Candidatus Coatesbacteria bacterium]